MAIVYFNQNTQSRLLASNLLGRSARRCCVRVFWFLCLWSIHALFADLTDASELDAASFHRAPVQTQLVWDRVDRQSDYHLLGESPNRAPLRFNEAFQLAPGQSTLVRIPAFESLKIQAVNTKNKADIQALEVWWSNGSGLFYQNAGVVDHVTGDRYFQSDHGKESVVRIQLPQNCQVTVRFDLYVSRRAGPKLEDFYRCQIENENLTSVEILCSKSPRPSSYYGLSAGQSACFHLPESAESWPHERKGLLRLRITSRLKYGRYQSQRHQVYWLLLLVDGRLQRIATVETLPITDCRTSIDGREAATGQDRYTYLQVSHSARMIEIIPSQDVYLQVDAADPSLNHDIFKGNINSEHAFSSLGHHLHDWLASDANKDRLPATLDRSVRNPFTVQQIVQSLSRDNSVPEAGLKAYMWARAIASQHTDDAQYANTHSVDEWLQTIKQHTRYADLLPNSKRNALVLERKILSEPTIDTNLLRQRLATHRHAATHEETATLHSVISDTWLVDRIESLPKATFCDISDTEPIEYTLPSRVGPGFIRMVLEIGTLTCPEQLWVQLDNRPPVLLEAVPMAGNSLRDFGPLKPSSTDCTLSAFAHHINREGQHAQEFARSPVPQTTLTGPYSIHGEPMATAVVASVTLFKPAHASTIRVWRASQSSPSAQTLRVALQYLTSRTSRLSESSYFGLQCLLNASQRFDIDSQASVRTWVARERENNSDELQVTLRHRVARLRQSVVASPELMEPGTYWTHEEINRSFERAEEFELDRQWPLAIEEYTNVIRNSRGDDRRRAILARIKALGNANEPMLVMTERRGWLLHSQDRILQQTLLEQLLASSTNDSSRLTLAAIACDLDLERCRSLLAKQLIDNGKHYTALQFLLESPFSEMDRELLLRLAYRNSWWRVFDSTVADTLDSELRCFWAAMKHLKHHRYGAAIQQLSHVSQRCELFRNYLESGSRIATALRDSPGVADNSIALWHAWITQNPFSIRWQSSNEAVVRSGGTVFVDSLESKSTIYFRSDSTQPAVCTFVGPTRVRLEIRPLHPVLSSEKIEDWIELKSVGESETRVSHAPIIANYPSANLTIDSEPTLIPGGLEIIELQIPSGVHRLHVQGENHPILLRVSQSRPELSGYILPPANKATLFSAAGLSNAPTMPSLHGTEQTQEPSIYRLQFLQGAAHQLLPVSSSHCAVHSPNSSFQHFAFNDFGSIQWSSSVPPNEQESHVAMPSIIGRDTVYSEAIYWTRYAQNANLDSKRRMAMVNLRNLVDTHPNRREIQRLASWVEQGSRWQLYEEFDSRAGVFQVQHQGWNPETPSTRIRKCLMDLLPDTSLVLTGGQSISLNLEPRDTRQFHLRLRRPDLGFTPLSSVDVLCESGRTVGPPAGERLEKTRLSIDNDSKFASAIRSSQNHFELHQQSPKQNHYIVAELFQIDHQRTDRTPTRFETLQPSFNRRTYQVALPDEPITFTVAGPRVLRIDELRAGRVFTRVLTVKNSRRIILESQSAEPSLYRVFELEHTQLRLPTYRLPPIRLAEPNSWQAPIVDLLYCENGASTSDADYCIPFNEPNSLRNSLTSDSQSFLRRSDPISASQSIGSFPTDGTFFWNQQELGTWAVVCGYQSRSPVEELNRNVSQEQFLETQIQHFKKWERLDYWSESSWTVRPRFSSGTTFGYSASVFKYLDNSDIDNLQRPSSKWTWSPWLLQTKTYGFIQNVDDSTGSLSEATPWILGGNVTVGRTQFLDSNWYHRPTLTLFGRLLSEDRNTLGPGDLDQDIFTPYKSDHPHGLVLSDRVVYQPQDDHRLWISPRYASNADDFSADNFGVQFGGDRLVGPLQLNISYRLTGYFKDKDRSRAATQNVVYVDLRYEKWHCRNRRSEINFRFRNQLDDGTTTLGLYYTGFWNPSRLYRDMNPLKLKFRGQREERAAPHFSRYATQTTL